MVKPGSQAIFAALGEQQDILSLAEEIITIIGGKKLKNDISILPEAENCPPGIHLIQTSLLTDDTTGNIEFLVPSIKVMFDMLIWNH